MFYFLNFHGYVTTCLFTSVLAFCSLLNQRNTIYKAKLHIDLAYYYILNILNVDQIFKKPNTNSWLNKQNTTKFDPTC